MKMKSLKLTTKIPPLILIGTILVLFPIFAYMTIDRINSQKTQSIKLLVEKSTALIRAFEAGANTGMMNMGWGREAMENLLVQTAALPDIVRLFIVNEKGTILVHSNMAMAGSSYGRDLNLSYVIQEAGKGWQIIDNGSGKKIFEVYEKFTPIPPRTRRSGMNMMKMHQRMHQRHFSNAAEYENTVIFVGLDMEMITQANKSDTRHNIMMGIILALIGFTGFLLVFIVQRYAAARSSLSRIRIFSDSLVENMPVGLIAVNMNQKIVSVNPAAESILNVHKPGKKSLSEGFRLPAPLDAILKDIAASKKVMEKEMQLTGLDDTAVMLDVIASPLYDKQGISLGSLLILRDKTELNQLKKKIEQNKRLATIGRLAAGVAHEIRNPLSSLKGYATFFKEIFDDSSDNSAIADTMIKEVDRLNRVVGELVELARPVSVAEKPLDLALLIQESIQMIEFEPEAQSIEIKTDLDSDVPQVNADKDRLKQVLLNLYLNAVQAMEGSGTLEIKLYADASRENAVITISDTGSGIRSEDLADIFEPYFTTKLSGTGLGLAIVHNIIKAHHGKIQVKSSPDTGTCFTIFIPIRISEK